MSVEPIAAGTIVYAVDPGDTASAIVELVVQPKGPPKLERFEYLPNKHAALWIETRRWEADHSYGAPRRLAMEMIASYGMPVGREVFETCVWIGGLRAAWGWEETTRIYRKDVKLHLCGQTKAKDANVSQAIRDLYGPNKAAAVGTKKAPGPLYGVSGDVWAALGVGLTFIAGAYTPADENEEEEEAA